MAIRAGLRHGLNVICRPVRSFEATGSRPCLTIVPRAVLKLVSLSAWRILLVIDRRLIMLRWAWPRAWN